MRAKAELDWRLLLLVLLVAAALLAGRTLYNAASIPLLADTDDAMRLAVVRDLLAGQGWYDHLQHRLNIPFGAEIHWSRLADLPVAALILAFRPFAGASAATLAAWIWPLLLLLPLLYLTARITLRLVGPDGLLPALLLPVFSLATLGEFAPGRIDHHSLQILLLLLMVWCSIEALDRPRAAIGAGLAAATAIAIGIESLPAIAAAILAFGLAWVFRPGHAAMLRGFGSSFALGTCAHLALALPPGRWLAPACDAISLVYAVAAVGTGAVFVLLSLLPLAQRPVWQRLALGLFAGGLLLLSLVVAFPTCLGGPYAAVDPWLRTHWIDRIAEAAPLWQNLFDDPAYAISVATPPLLALGVVGWHLLRRSDDRDRWLVYGAFLLLALITMLLQVRGSRLAASLAAPAGAWLILAARRRYLALPSAGSIAALLAAWIGFAGLALLVIVQGIVLILPGQPDGGDAATPPDRRQCIMPSAFTRLAALPPARIMAPIDLGSHLLAFTPHAVVAAPYHRNHRGVRDAFEFFNGPLADARRILAARGVTLVVVCPAMPELAGHEDAAPDSFVSQYAADKLPGWLVEHELPGTPLRIFAVMPAAADARSAPGRPQAAP